MVNGVKPKTLTEALELRRNMPRAIPYAGGTHLMRDGGNEKTYLYLHGCEELTRTGSDGTKLHLGAMITLAELVRDGAAPLPLREAAKTLPASHRVLATLGGETLSGNLPLLCVLYALSAEARLASVTTRRTLALDRFFRDGHSASMGANELLCEILLPERPMDSVFRHIEADDPRDDIYFAGRLELKGDRVAAVTAVFASPREGLRRFPAVEKNLVGKTESEYFALREELLAAYEAGVFPGDSPAREWQRAMTRRLLSEFLFGG